MNDATLLLTAMEQGDPTAADKLLELLYEELRRLAASKMAGAHKAAILLVALGERLGGEVLSRLDLARVRGRHRARRSERQSERHHHRCRPFPRK